jgi:hypothetical protein
MTTTFENVAEIDELAHLIQECLDAEAQRRIAASGSDAGSFSLLTAVRALIVVAGRAISSGVLVTEGKAPSSAVITHGLHSIVNELEFLDDAPA